MLSHRWLMFECQHSTRCLDERFVEWRLQKQSGDVDRQPSSSCRCRPPQAVRTGDLTPPWSAAKQGRRQEPCTIILHLRAHDSRFTTPRFPAAVLLRLAITGFNSKDTPKAGQDCSRHPIFRSISNTNSGYSWRIHFASRQLGPHPISTNSGTANGYACSISRLTSCVTSGSSSGGDSSSSSSCTWSSSALR